MATLVTNLSLFGFPQNFAICAGFKHENKFLKKS